MRADLRSSQIKKKNLAAGGADKLFNFNFTASVRFGRVGRSPSSRLSRKLKNVNVSPRCSDLQSDLQLDQWSSDQFLSARVYLTILMSVRGAPNCHYMSNVILQL